jgi:predicted RNA-binding Zn ribbon-like protein
MRLSRKYAVPAELALLYEFLNSTDLRTYVEQGEQHMPSDELKTPAQLNNWMRERGLLNKNDSIASVDHRRALELRGALRRYVQLTPGSRPGAQKLAEDLNRLTAYFSLAVKINRHGAVELQPTQRGGGLARVLAEFFSLAVSGRLDHLKMCSSDECHWIFFDRSKPGNRRWCSSLRCGNRQKTRDYRKRVKAHVRSE